MVFPLNIAIDDLDKIRETHLIPESSINKIYRDRRVQCKLKSQMDKCKCSWMQTQCRIKATKQCSWKRTRNETFLSECFLEPNSMFSKVQQGYKLCEFELMFF